MLRIDSKRAKAVEANAAEAASLLRALSHGARLSVACELVGGERSAGALVKASGLGQSALSQHLAVLRAEKVVATRRDGRTIHYRLADTRVERLIGTLHELFCKGQ